MASAEFALGITKHFMASAKMKMASAEARLASAKHFVASAESRMASAKARMAILKSALASAEAPLAIATAGMASEIHGESSQVVPRGVLHPEMMGGLGWHGRDLWATMLET